jgi:hypothetical protein
MRSCAREGGCVTKIHLVIGSCISLIIRRVGGDDTNGGTLYSENLY